MSPQLMAQMVTVEHAARISRSAARARSLTAVRGTDAPGVCRASGSGATFRPGSAARRVMAAAALVLRFGTR